MDPTETTASAFLFFPFPDPVGSGFADDRVGLAGLTVNADDDVKSAVADVADVAEDACVPSLTAAATPLATFGGAHGIAVTISVTIAGQRTVTRALKNKLKRENY